MIVGRNDMAKSGVHHICVPLPSCFQAEDTAPTNRSWKISAGLVQLRPSLFPSIPSSVAPT
jgi:hypothetical protein